MKDNSTGGIKEHRIYIGDREVYRKTTADGVTIDTERETLHISDDTGRIALVDKLTVENQTPIANGQQLIRYQFSNHLGSAALELDDTAAIISYEEYHPFGTTSYRAGRNQVETSLKRYRYVGKERDEETGLYYYGARYYAAWLARFVSVDPLKNNYPQLASYQYAENDPIGDLDIDGLEGTKTESRDPKENIPDKPEISNTIGSYVEKCRPELRTIFNEQTTLEGKQAVAKEVLGAMKEDIEQVKTDLRADLKEKFFIDKIDGKYKFDRASATKAYQAIVDAGELSQEELIPTLKALRHRADNILTDAKFDSFVFEGQHAQHIAEGREQMAVQAQRRAEAERRAAERANRPSDLAVAADAVGTAGDIMEVAGIA